MAISMTPAASERVKSFLSNRGKGIGLRLGLKTSGCSGMVYVIEFVDELNDDDEVYEVADVKIIIDAKSFIYLQGIELDFVKEGLNEGFQFNNPNAKGECGCGESFTV
ncbi:iron-sulfur cluster assembly protein IscA [Shewanella psychropiezotolerans]|uniref:Iron-binding protein IscA n=1 Tax=Shewanella psychropiezotolerans TaxID=2593655 RepID=A0ABX5X2U7_9GAMM|nr:MULTISPECIES: iron-sulfur cluster assembly protein IscA [Shewanella]MBE7216364.1 iron-sulfur cluster assembly protein IscA [Shewanella benthica]MBL4816330.1 iron-sulfur cluster assembly protein IscA [Shewanella sp.]MCJ8304496.1 iron-sulfur cluster assembly protein IscA [Shewanella sp.]MCL1064641.1 iron-sulfur cluster assembly protein IscA [Shewanella benthica]MPY26030.1 iron-sulfur cluster assembly protein IscA [Shewanella sp. YLB-07]